MSSRTRAALSGAIITAVGLGGGLLLGLALGNLVFFVLEGRVGEALRTALAAAPAIAGLGLGAAAWGRLMGRLAKATDTRRAAWGGVLGFGPITLLAGAGLLMLEPLALERWGARVPLHRLFTVMFVPTAGIVAGVSSLALGLALGRRSLGWALAWRAAGAAGAAFLTVDLVMEALGWQVGGPGAAERLTMITVMSVSNLGAAVVAGAVVGARLRAEPVEVGKRSLPS